MSLTGHEQPELPSSDEEMDDAASNFSSTSSEQVTGEFVTEVLTWKKHFSTKWIYCTVS